MVHYIVVQIVSHSWIFWVLGQPRKNKKKIKGLCSEHWISPIDILSWGKYAWFWLKTSAGCGTWMFKTLACFTFTYHNINKQCPCSFCFCTKLWKKEEDRLEKKSTGVVIIHCGHSFCTEYYHAVIEALRWHFNRMKSSICQKQYGVIMFTLPSIALHNC